MKIKNKRRVLIAFSAIVLAAVALSCFAIFCSAEEADFATEQEAIEAKNRIDSFDSNAIISSYAFFQVDDLHASDLVPPDQIVSLLGRTYPPRGFYVSDLSDCILTKESSPGETFDKNYYNVPGAYFDSPSLNLQSGHDYIFTAAVLGSVYYNSPSYAYHNPKLNQNLIIGCGGAYSDSALIVHRYDGSPIEAFVDFDNELNIALRYDDPSSPEYGAYGDEQTRFYRIVIHAYDVTDAVRDDYEVRISYLQRLLFNADSETMENPVFAFFDGVFKGVNDTLQTFFDLPLFGSAVKLGPIVALGVVVLLVIIILKVIL